MMYMTVMGTEFRNSSNIYQLSTIKALTSDSGGVSLLFLFVSPAKLTVML